MTDVIFLPQRKSVGPVFCVVVVSVSDVLPVLGVPVDDEVVVCDCVHETQLHHIVIVLVEKKIYDKMYEYFLPMEFQLMELWSLPIRQ